MSVWETAADNIGEKCLIDKKFEAIVKRLDQYDFSKYFAYECSDLEDIKFGITEDFPELIKVFKTINNTDLTDYFTSRYDIWFQEVREWVVRKENGAYAKVAKRSEDCP